MRKRVIETVVQIVAALLIMLVIVPAGINLYHSLTAPAIELVERPERVGPLPGNPPGVQLKRRNRD